jgi:hypothetical protein
MRRDRRKGGRFGVAGALLALAIAPAFARSAATTAADDDVPHAGGFVGPATCDSSRCHGSTRPLDGRVRQDEYATWFGEDAHRRAFESLTSPLGRAISQRLAIETTHAPACLACHATGDAAASGAAPDDEARLAEFGVGCESCHGAASGWYGSHFQSGFDRATAVASLGLVDTKEPATLVAACLRCHLGDATHVVDHRLLAAGHPELRFEAGSRLLSMSPHWRQRGDASRAWFVRAALAGPLVALRMELEKAAREATASGALDWSGRNCSSCHHDLSDSGWEQLRDWRVAHGLAVPVGAPLLDTSRFASAAAIAAACDAALGASLRQSLAKVETLAHAAPPDGAALAEAATAAATQVARALESLQVAAPSELAALDALAIRVAATLARDADAVAAAGFAGADHAALLLHSLAATFDDAKWSVRRGGPAEQIRAELLAPLTRPAEFRPADFARAMGPHVGK